MGAETEAAGDVLTGAIVAGTVEGKAGAPAPDEPGAIAGTCRNCGARLTGRFCSTCGQAMHLHRSLLALGYEILHGVFMRDNPSLTLYKLKVSGYKFAWALIPLSMPFLWLLFFWRFDIRMYDHAIFATYSICFVMLLLIVLSLAATAGLGEGVWATIFFLVPPIHMYRQLRGAYGLSRFGAYVRLFLLLNATVIVLTIFSILLFFLGALN